jgi:hypothetical protein
MKYLLQKLHKYILDTLTWSRVFTIAKKVTSVVTLTVNIRVLVKTNWRSIGVWDLEREYRRGTYCYSGEENALNLGIINGFAKAWNSFQRAFLNLKNISIMQVNIMKCRSTYDSMLRFQSIIHQRQNICKHIRSIIGERGKRLAYVL